MRQLASPTNAFDQPGQGQVHSSIREFSANSQDVLMVWQTISPGSMHSESQENNAAIEIDAQFI
jgi:hypothetical protein